MTSDLFTPERTPRDRARLGDPETSKAAAAQLNPKWTRELYQRIMRAFTVLGDMDDKALIAAVHEMEDALGIKRSSESGIRSRRSELAKPNMDRLDEIAVEMGRDRDMAWPTGRAFGDLRAICGYADLSDTSAACCYVTGRPIDKASAVLRLRTEGFRSPLWDTGRRIVIDNRHVIVWGLAR